MKLEYYRQSFEKSSIFKFNENPLSGSRVVPCGLTYRRTGTHGEADCRFHNIANAPKEWKFLE
jgi:hypothetical protein